LKSVLAGGLTPADYSHFLKEITESYGFGQTQTFMNLEKSGFLFEKSKKRFVDETTSFPAWKDCIRNLELLAEEKPGLNNIFPRDDRSHPSYPYCGYTCLFSKLVYHWINRDSTERYSRNVVDAAFKIIPGAKLEKFDETLKTPILDKVLIFVIGGITYSEA
jgi:hypothetical protein